MFADYRGREIEPGDRVCFDGHWYTIRGFRPGQGSQGCAAIDFVEPQHTTAIADERAVNLSDDDVKRRESLHQIQEEARACANDVLNELGNLADYLDDLGRDADIVEVNAARDSIEGIRNSLSLRIRKNHLRSLNRADE